MTISGKTQLVGLIGWPVSHSFSPAMHNAAFAAAGLDWLYVAMPVRVEEMVTAVPALPTLGFRGVNATVPHKQAIMPLLDEIEEGAQAIGAVNTIVVERGAEGQGGRGAGETDDRLLMTDYRLLGYNTDWSGFLADLREMGIAVNGRDCLVMGAGGSARAVGYGLAQAGARVQLLARRVEQAEVVVVDLRPFCPANSLLAQPLSALHTIVSNTTAPLIVNTTPLGMAPQIDTTVWPEGCPFPANAVVYDLVYNPAQTKLMRQAQAAGCRAENGLGMLIHQGAEAFRLWTGQMPDVGVMKTAVLSVTT
jgi:shikimate dehydrogenase